MPNRTIQFSQIRGIQINKTPNSQFSPFLLKIPIKSNKKFEKIRIYLSFLQTIRRESERRTMAVQSSLSIAAELGVSLRVADSLIDRHFFITKQAIVGHYRRFFSFSFDSTNKISKFQLRWRNWQRSVKRYGDTVFSFSYRKGPNGRFWI